MSLNVERYRNMRAIRRYFLAVWALGLACVALPGAWAAEPPLPQRNLVVQWRVLVAGQIQRSAQGVRAGEVVVDSQRGVSGKAVITWSTATLDDEQHVDGQVLVLNGAEARLLMSRQQPVLNWFWSCHPAPCTNQASQGRVGVSTSWVDRGQGLTVQPRWPGGNAPLAMRFEVEADSDAQEQASGIQRRVQSTVMMPMDTWVTVAESGVQSDRRTRQQAGLYSTDESQQSQWLLQIRVRRP
jgi:hypothetical protein